MIKSHSSLLHDTEPSLESSNKINLEYDKIKKQRAEELIKIIEIIHEDMLNEVSNALEEYKKKAIYNIKINGGF
tara:strand:+ start:316 stop:537 length:222 start_codon:yes stop_codon:yes gene_type:complete